MWFAFCTARCLRPGFRRRASRASAVLSRRIRPSRCIRHDMSLAVSTSVPACRWSAMRSFPIIHETASSLTANVPPKPQHSSGRCNCVNSIPSTNFSSCSALPKLGPTSSLSLRQSQLAQAVATLMQADAMRKPHVEPLDLQHVGQKFAQLERLALQLLEAGLAVQQFVVMVPHHRHATSRRGDDVFVVAENLAETAEPAAGPLPCSRYWPSAGRNRFARRETRPRTPHRSSNSTVAIPTCGYN